LVPALPLSLHADVWHVHSAGDQRQAQVPDTFSWGASIQPGDAWPNDDRFRWLVGDLEIPATIDDKASQGMPVGMRLSCGDGGEVWLNGQLAARFDNDHPALVMLSTNATPGRQVRVVMQVYGKVQGGDRFSEAKWVIVDRPRALDRLPLVVDAANVQGPVPDGLIGLSQGGGMADYEEATARKLKEGGFKWFRMDNIFTQVLKAREDGSLVYDWTDFDRRLDFLHQIGADAILCVSYMPQVLDAVPNHERQSAPKDYQLWETLCYEAANRAVDRDRRAPFWEVWNEVNTGWLKPGPEDKGTEEFGLLYSRALGKDATDPEVVRRFEAYCKLYQATVRGVLRADPKAKFGGPALASGPFEHEDCGHCFHGRGFARGLMLWCEQQGLPLDFVSWHEYFQPPETVKREAEAFRSYMEDLPRIRQSVQSFMVTEWNEAWWQDRPQDHELGAAWCANTVTRAFIPAGIDRPCFFYVKQGDDRFRGDYSLLMGGNVPKASYNMARLFNGLSGRWVPVTGGDEDVSAVAAWDEARGRLAVVLVNFRDRYGLRRNVDLQIDNVPKILAGGTWKEWVVDGTRGNVWHDRSKAELTESASGLIDPATWTLQRTLMPNSVTLVELLRPGTR